MSRARRAALGAVGIVTLLVALGRLPAAAELPPYLDRVTLKDGRQWVGQLVDVTADRVDIRIRGELRFARRADVAEIEPREAAYLRLGREARDAGRLREALALFDHVRNAHRQGQEVAAREASAQLIRTLEHLAAQEYRDVLIKRDGRYLIGRILLERPQSIRIQLDLGSLDVPRAELTRTLHKEAQALAAADTLLAAGKLDAAIARLTRIHEDEHTSKVWQSRVASRLSAALLKVAAEAQGKGDLVQARQLLERAAALAPSDAAVRAQLEAVRTQLDALRKQRRAKADALMAQARPLLAAEDYAGAYKKLVAALNLAPEVPGLRDLIDRCLDNIQILDYGDFDDPGTLDPLTANKRVERRLSRLLYNSLITRDERERFVYDLASKVETSPSGMMFTFWLRPGVTWSSGHEVTARDVEFTLQLLTNPRTHNHNPTFAQFIERVEVLGPYQLRIRLRRPFYRPLSLFSFMIVPRRPFQATHLDRTNPFCRQPIGSGPFAYKEGLGSRVIVLARNPKYHKPAQPYLTGVRLKRYQDRQSARSDLERGELHLLTELRPLDVEFFEKLGARYTVRQYRARTIYFLAFNYRNPIFSQRGLRRAIAHVIDRQSILEQFFNAGNPLKRRGGQAHAVITGPFPYNAWAYNDAVAEYRYDKDYAAKLLQDVMQPLGWRREGLAGTYGGRRFWRKDGHDLTLRLKYAKGDRNVEKACIYIADSLKRIGINVRLAQKAPRDLFDETVNEHDFDLVYASYTFDDTYDVFPLFDPRRRGRGGSNFSGYVNPGLVRLFDQMQKTLNPRRILALSHEIHRRVHDEAVFCFLWQLDQYAAHTNDLRNVRIHPYDLFGEVDGWKILKGPR